MASRQITKMLALAGFCVAVAACDTGEDGAASTASDERVARGLEVSPVPVNLSGRDRDLVGLGSYIVNAQAACNDCHTCPQFAPGHDPFQGEPGRDNAENFLAGGRAFGPIVAPAITPDAQGRPGGLTLDRFVQVMRTGRDPDATGRILQIMPWPVYARMTDHDLEAIYEYLSALPPASPGVCEPL